MRRLLQPAHPPPRGLRLATEEDHWYVGVPRIHDRGQGVANAGPGGHRRDARLSGHARPSVRGERRGLLVPHINHADALVQGSLVNRKDVTAAEGKEDLNALVGEGFPEDLPARPHEDA